MLNEQERIERLTQIGASDIHKIFNFDNKGVVDLWKEKLGIEERKEISTQYMLVGNLLEEDCLKYFFNQMKIKDYTLNERVEHSKIKNFVVSTDGLIGNIPVENKTTNFDKYTQLSSPERSHYIQLQAQLSCTGGEYGYIVYNAIEDEDYINPLLYKPSALKQQYYMVYADCDLITEIEKRAKYFLWCLQYKREPSETHYSSMYFGGLL